MNLKALFVVLLVTLFSGYEAAPWSDNMIVKQRGPIQGYTPTTKYLQNWTEKFTELHEIPLCKDIPIKSTEESMIEKKCYQDSDPSNICMNIRLFKIVRDMCYNEFTKNVPEFLNAIVEIENELGIFEFLLTDIKEVYRMIEMKTGIEISGFLENNVADLIGEYAIVVIGNALDAFN